MNYFDIASKWQVLFQDPASPIMEGIIEFHHDIMFLLIFIVFFILFLLGYIVINFENNDKPDLFKHNTFLEIVWTLIPSLVLLIVAIPSFSLLYSIDELSKPALTLKSIGHQWYWTYEYSDYAVEHGTLGIESYMVAESDLTIGCYRLLETHYRVVLPINVHVRSLVTSGDVLHSWAVPSLGVKTDACPGRLNQFSLLIKRPGVFYGQCSEICGVNHGFMPIVVQGVTLEEYYSWFSSKLSSKN
jgi:cytochrome c oxidase subunit 2